MPWRVRLVSEVAENYVGRSPHQVDQYPSIGCVARGGNQNSNRPVDQLSAARLVLSRLDKILHGHARLEASKIELVLNCALIGKSEDAWSGLDPRRQWQKGKMFVKTLRG